MGNIGKKIWRRISNPKRPGIPIKIPEKVKEWEPAREPALVPKREKQNAS